MGRKKKTEHLLLTQLELQIMNAVWEAGAVTAAQVQERILGELAYTTISTVLRVLEEKGFVQSDRSSKQYIYSARITKQDYESRTLDDVIKNIFDDQPANLIKRLVEYEKLSDSDLAAIKDLLSKGGRKS